MSTHCVPHYVYEFPIKAFGNDRKIMVPPHPIYFGSGIDEPELSSLPAFVLIVTDSLLARNRFPRRGEGITNKSSLTYFVFSEIEPEMYFLRYFLW